MSSPLLTTKLYIPPVRPDPSTGLRTGLVSRPRLVERLNAGRHRKLTLISAPAGFGKTVWSEVDVPSKARGGGCACTLEDIVSRVCKRSNLSREDRSRPIPAARRAQR